MKSKSLRHAICLLLIAALSVLLGFCSFGESDGETVPADDLRYTNPKTGYKVYIIDEEDLLTEDEEVKLLEDMKPITEFGHIIFWSTKEKTTSETRLAMDKRYELCQNASSGIFVINMRTHMVTFQSDGKIYDYVSSSRARSITDNVSGYASKKNYYKCASEAFKQVLTLLHGNRIAEPMKYFSFIVIGLMLSFVIVVGLVFSKWFNPLIKRRGKAKRIETGERIKGAVHFTMTDSRQRGWVIALEVFGRILIEILLRGGGSSDRSDRSGGSGRSSGGGRSGGGGSSRF